MLKQSYFKAHFNYKKGHTAFNFVKKILCNSNEIKFTKNIFLFIFLGGGGVEGERVVEIEHPKNGEVEIDDPKMGWWR